MIEKMFGTGDTSLKEDQPGEIFASSKSSTNASGCVFERMRVALLAHTPVVGMSVFPPEELPAVVAPLEDPLLDATAPLDEPLLLPEATVPLDDPPLLEAIVPLDEPLLPEAIVPLDDPLLFEAAVPLEEPSLARPPEEPDVTGALVPVDPASGLSRGKYTRDDPEHAAPSCIATTVNAMPQAPFAPLKYA